MPEIVHYEVTQTRKVTVNSVKGVTGALEAASEKLDAGDHTVVVTETVVRRVR